jgi:hypothetical protein
MTDMRNITYSITLSPLVSFLVERGRKERKGRRIRKEESILPEVHSRTTILERRTLLV